MLERSSRPAPERFNISAWAIRHPIPTIILFVLMTVAGVASYPSLRINNTPDVDLPTLTVIAGLAGAAPTEVETLVTRKVEDALAAAANVQHINSTLTEGTSTSFVTFAFGTDMERAAADVRERMARLRTDLPADATDPVVSKVTRAGGAIATYVVSSPGRDVAELSWFVDDTVATAVRSISGVAQVTRLGGVDREIRVSLDPDRLTALGITAEDVTNQIRALNSNSPGGRGTVGQRELSIRAVGSVTSLDELRDLMIVAGGRSARLAELGTVADVATDARQLARLNGQPVVAFEVARAVGSSEVHVARQLQARIAQVAAASPQMRIERVSDTTRFVETSYRGAIEALLVGATLAVVVVFVFLREVRATVIACVAMPLSLVPTFVVMSLLDFSLNLVTLLALSLVIGVLVDDAIVEIENIARHIREGKTPYDAAMEASAEIGLAVMATTASIVAVFLPVAFMPGIPGQFFAPFGFTVVTAVVVSLLVARLLTPLMGAFLLKPRVRREQGDGPILRAYLALLGWCLHHRIVTLISGFVFLGASVALIPRLTVEFVPSADRGQSNLAVELPVGSTLAHTDAAVQAITAIVVAHREVNKVFSTVGVGTANLQIILIPRNARASTQQQFESVLRPELDQMAGVRTRFGAFGTGASVQVTLTGADSAQLSAAAATLAAQMRTLPALANITASGGPARQELRIVPLRDRAAELGVSIGQVATTARIATLGDADARLPKFSLPNRQIPIRVELAEAARNDLGVLRNLRIASSRGLSVPISSVATMEFGAGPAQITRLDRSRTATVGATVIGIAASAATAQVNALPIMQKLPAGVRPAASGDSEAIAQLLASFSVALIAALLLVYTVLAILFGGFLQPLTIMTALPFSLGGALLMLLITGKPLSLPVFIGILMLMGIVAKNSILLVDYVMHGYRAGGTRTDAIIEAARKRARPIVMTTLAMTAGMAQIALGIGADAEFRSPMAVAVIGGLITSTLLSLIYVPIVFTYMDDLEHRLGRWLGRVVTSGPQDSSGENEGDVRRPRPA